MKSSVFWDITPCTPLKVNQLHGTISQKTELFNLTVFQMVNKFLGFNGIRWFFIGVYMSPPLDLILSQTKPADILTPYFFNIYKSTNINEKN
jgi:hypothetical protein